MFLSIDTTGISPIFNHNKCNPSTYLLTAQINIPVSPKVLKPEARKSECSRAPWSTPNCPHWVPSGLGVFSHAHALCPKLIAFPCFLVFGFFSHGENSNQTKCGTIKYTRTISLRHRHIWTINNLKNKYRMKVDYSRLVDNMESLVSPHFISWLITTVFALGTCVVLSNLQPTRCSWSNDLLQRVSVWLFWAVVVLSCAWI